MRRSTRSSRPASTPVVVGGTGLYLRAALADLDLPPAPEPGARERWEEVYDGRAPSVRTRCSPSAIRKRPRPSTRTTGGGSCARSSSPRPELAALRTGPPLDRGDAAPDARLRARRAKRGARAADRRASAGDVRRGRAREVERALAGRISRTARYALGVAEIAEHPDDEDAIEALIAPDEALRGVPAQVDAADSGPC